MVGVGVAAVSMFVQCSAPVPVPVAGGGTRESSSREGRAHYCIPLTSHNRYTAQLRYVYSHRLDHG